MVSINILTNDKHLWLLKGFSYCFNKFWPNENVIVWGFGHPDFALPRNFSFVSLAKNNWPAQRWSNALIEMCRQIEDDYFILMLEDYWLVEKVNRFGIVLMNGYIRKTDGVLRIDLSGNRAAYSQAEFENVIRGYEIVRTPMHTPYQMSFQAAIWNRRSLLSVLRENETPWEAEVYGSARLREKEQYQVLGAKDKLLNYVPVYRTKGHGLLLEKMPKSLVRELDKRGYLL